MSLLSRIMIIDKKLLLFYPVSDQLVGKVLSQSFGEFQWLLGQ